MAASCHRLRGVRQLQVTELKRTLQLQRSGKQQTSKGRRALTLIIWFRLIRRGGGIFVRIGCRGGGDGWTAVLSDLIVGTFWPAADGYNTLTRAASVRMSQDSSGQANAKHRPLPFSY